MNAVRQLIPFACDPRHSLPPLLGWHGPLTHARSSADALPSAAGVYAFCVQLAPDDLPLPFYFGKGKSLISRIPKYHTNYVDRLQKGLNRLVHDVLDKIPPAYVRLYWFECDDCEKAEQSLLREHEHLWLVNVQDRGKALIDAHTAAGFWQAIGIVLQSQVKSAVR